MLIGKISSDDLKLLLKLYPQMMGKEFDEARQMLLENQELFLGVDAEKAVWCHYYEQPAKVHFGMSMIDIGGEQVLREIVTSPNQLQAMPPAVDKFLAGIDSWEPTESEKTVIKQKLQRIFGLGISNLNSVRCLMIYGQYLNDLIAIVRAGGKDADTALLRAVKIDPTVMGCPSVIVRISRAVMLDDQKFLNNVRKAMSGKLTKREQKTYQQMRLVLQVLHETEAPKLGKDDLYMLFREELNIVRDEAGEGDVKNALRQFAYQFMKQKSVSETP